MDDPHPSFILVCFIFLLQQDHNRLSVPFLIELFCLYMCTRGHTCFSNARQQANIDLFFFFPYKESNQWKLRRRRKKKAIKKLTTVTNIQTKNKSESNIFFYNVSSIK